MKKTDRIKIKLTGLLAVTAVLTTLTGCAVNPFLSHESVDAGMRRIAEGDYEGALTDFSTALAAGESKRLVYRGRGIACYRMGDYEEAIAAFQQALKETGGIIDGADHDMNFYIADCYRRTGRPSAAISVYTTILDLKQEDAEAYYLRGCARLETGEAENAQADFNEVLRLKPTDYDRLFLIYEAYAASGRADIGRAMVEAVYADASENLSDYDRGRFAYYLGDQAAAMKALENARSAGGAEVIDAVLLLGQIAEEQGDYDYAEGVYRSYLRNNRENARVYNRLGLSELKSGRLDAAISDFESGLSLDDASMRQDLNWNIVVAYEKKGEFGTALERLKTYLERYPTDEKALREYLFLSTR